MKRRAGPPWGALLVTVAGLGLSVGCPPPRPPVRPKPRPRPLVTPAVVGTPFHPPGSGLPFMRFIFDRAVMHGYLYNGDDLYPKAVNLCARGRNALLDLDLGPGASYRAGLLGSAWESHLFAVALDRPPGVRDPAREGRTRLVLSWPVVSSAHLDRLPRVHRAWRHLLAARDAPPAQQLAAWERNTALRGHLRFDAFLALRHPTLRVPGRRFSAATPSQRAALLAAAADWHRRMVRAYLERLRFAAEFLRLPWGRGEWSDIPDHATLQRRLLAPNRDAAALLGRYSRALDRRARRAGVHYDSTRYLRFHRSHLTATIPWSGRRSSRVTVDQLAAIIRAFTKARRRFEQRFGHSWPPSASAPRPRNVSRGRWRQAARRARVLAIARREHARISFVAKGKRTPDFPRARAHYGLPELAAARFLQLLLDIEFVGIRERLSRLARAQMPAAVRARLRRQLDGGERVFAVGSYFFETEHLLETTSAFTHVGIIKVMQGPKDKTAILYQFDRVLGFHYAYPVAKLKNSVPVQILALSHRLRARRRRYRWLRLRIPTSFRFPSGHRSGEVSLINLFSHVRRLLTECPALGTSPGFYYSGVTWMMNHPANQALFAGAWSSRVHTGYGYRSLDRQALQRLKGRVIHVPVAYRADRPWGVRCPVKRVGPRQERSEPLLQITGSRHDKEISRDAQLTLRR